MKLYIGRSQPLLEREAVNGFNFIKSKYMNGLQCSMLLWFVMNSPEALSEIEEDRQFIFDQGHEVGNYVKKLFPKGLDVPHDSNFIEATGKFFSQRDTIFEGAFSYRGTFNELLDYNAMGVSGAPEC